MDFFYLQISYYLVDENAKYDDFITDKNHIQMMKDATKQFNYAINQFYNLKFINNELNKIDLYLKFIWKHLEVTKKILSNIEEDKKAIFFERFYNLFKEGKSLFFTFHYLKDNACSYMDNENSLLFKKMHSNLDIEDGQKYLFKGSLFEIVTLQKMAKLKNFIQDNQLRGYLKVDIFLPFFNSNYNKTNCLSKNLLPKFYSTITD